MTQVLSPDDQLRHAMLAEKWTKEYVDNLIDHMEQLRKAGVSKLLAQKLVQLHKQDGYRLTAEDGAGKGREFGTLRNKDSAVAAYEEYMSKRYRYEADEIIGLVVAYATGVRESSWAQMVQIVKAFLISQRTAPDPGAYFWKDISDSPQTWEQAQTSIEVFRAKRLGPAYSPQDKKKRDAKLAAAITSWHAFTQELLNNTMFPGNDPQTRTVTVVRTESAEAARNFFRNGKQLTEEECKDLSKFNNVTLTAKRGALESSSLYTVKNIFGHVVTECKVPYHRVFALYMTAQPKSEGHMLSFFENDSENELTFMPEGLPFVLKDLKDLSWASPGTEKQSFTW